MLTRCPVYAKLLPLIINRYDDPCSIFAIAYKPKGHHHDLKKQDEDENDKLLS
jgi:hypothetical protein